MKPSKVVVWLSFLIVVLALIATGTGLFWQGSDGDGDGDGEGPFSFTTVRGQTVEMYGRGLYRYDSLFTGATYKANDAVTLVLAIPLLVLLTVFYWKGSLRAGLLLTGMLSYFSYVYATMALNAAYNSLFLVYVALFSASFFALLLALRSIDSQALAARFSPTLPRRGPAAFLFAGGLLTLVVWLSPLLDALRQGVAPALLETYSTPVTFALDLAIVTPATFVVGGLILRRAPLGYCLAFPILGLILMLGPTITAATVNQVRAGIQFTTAEAAGPIGGFGLLGLLAIWVTVALLRNIDGPVTVGGATGRTGLGTGGNAGRKRKRGVSG